MKRRLLPLFLLLPAAFVGAQTNIDTTLRHAWAENLGWTDFFGNGADGVRLHDTFLSGYAWNENVGWIFFGDGTPGADGGTRYAMTGGDIGVNREPGGSLSGFAWGENIGWVNFERVTIDAQGHFAGHAWGENVGWIVMATPFGVKADIEVDPPPVDGIEGWMLF